VEGEQAAETDARHGSFDRMSRFGSRSLPSSFPVPILDCLFAWTYPAGTPFPHDFLQPSGHFHVPDHIPTNLPAVASAQLGDTSRTQAHWSQKGRVAILTGGGNGNGNGKVAAGSGKSGKAGKKTEKSCPAPNEFRIHGVEKACRMSRFMTSSLVGMSLSSVTCHCHVVA
jgi:hypothetical protein